MKGKGKDSVLGRTRVDEEGVYVRKQLMANLSEADLMTKWKKIRPGAEGGENVL